MEHEALGLMTPQSARSRNTPLAKKGLLGLGKGIAGAWLIGGILFIESGAVSVGSSGRRLAGTLPQ